MLSSDDEEPMGSPSPDSGIQKLEKMYADLQATPLQKDLTPLFGLAAALGGKDVSGFYQRPENQKERESRLANLASIISQRQMAKGMQEQRLQLAKDAQETKKEIATQNNEVKKLIAGQKMGPLGQKLTPAQESVDKKFGQDYAEFYAGGGSADTTRNIGQLEQIRDRLAKGEPLTGKAVGTIPDSIKAYVNPTALSAKQQVQESIQRTLRQILGAAFTEREGTQVIQRAYDDRLSPEENVKKLDRTINQMKNQLAAKNAAAKFYEQNGTLAGYNGSLPSLSTFDNESGAAAPDGATNAAPDMVMIEHQGKKYKIKPDKLADALKAGAKQVQ